MAKHDDEEYVRGVVHAITVDLPPVREAMEAAIDVMVRDAQADASLFHTGRRYAYTKALEALIEAVNQVRKEVAPAHGADP